ncbi:hypothetical protein POM88_021793 [Heracleum sosnowskyi]|uniref:Ubiquitin-like protease family profile domain-containing protein n=1 Tax=Heracleum sosnowskyi TaxID=360622 RepID=A0AAD8IGJ6_9APIA|nr:hypothetical protein POM88_021793 [Heracleum sosnowskyi]
MLDIVVRDEMENEEGMDTPDSVELSTMVVEENFYEHLVNFESGKTNADVENEELLSVQEHILDMDVGVNKIMANIGVDVGHNMQSCDDQEIKKHFEEDTYMISFENNLKEFVDVYGRCLNNFEVTLALYPQNIWLSELKKEYSQYFKMFEVASPIAKNILVGQIVPKYVIDEHDVNHMVRENGNATGEMVKPHREIKASHLCRSPYVSRVVDVISHVITTEERNVWQWLFKNRKNIKENLFEWNGRKWKKAHFQSLQDNKMIMSTVIDLWTYLLNENEILKDDSSPLRLFMTTETTARALYLNKSECSYSSKIGRYAAFDDHIDVVIKMVNEMHNKQYEVKDFDMFVFPIFNSAHFYIISYNMKKTRLEIIDNRVQTAGVEETYGDLPAKLENQQQLLNKLRIIYCHNILTWSKNSKKTIILEDAANLGKGK